jgi:hypothetical protein
MIGWVALVLGVAVVVVAVFGYRKAFRLRLSRAHRTALWSGALIVGAILSLSLGYPLDERTRVYGFPLPAAAFQRDEGGAWLDFVGPFTTPFMLLNWVVHTGTVLYVACVLMARRMAKQGQATEHGA